MTEFSEQIDRYLEYHFNTNKQNATPQQLYNAMCMAAVKQLEWRKDHSKKRACYFSAEFLVGRMVYSNLMNMGLLDEANEYLRQIGKDVSIFEDIEDNALGNGGLGRLAACFLDSAATHSIPLDGYGIRYRYGLFKQSMECGFQKEQPDNWQQCGDPWSVRCESESVTVHFSDQNIVAVPYDMPVIGWGGCVNTLRLWQAEAEKNIDFEKFNEQEYGEAFKETNLAEAISAVLYPNDDTAEGKKLRLKQQYFFSSASLQSILRDFISEHGQDFEKLGDYYAIQLNDTHPVIAIPELIRLLCEDYELTTENAVEIARRIFAYTNHTVMAEAMEKWDVQLFASTLPDVYAYVVTLNNMLRRELTMRNITECNDEYMLISGGQIHMAHMAVYASHSTNGVAQIHTDILKNNVLKSWYQLYPERFNNKTNGITQRRWLRLCNPELSALITEKIGDSWITQLDHLKGFEQFANDSYVIDRFQQIKREKKCQLADYIKRTEGFDLNPDYIFDIQIKRLHEYKRQLLNALGLLDLYYGIKEGSINDFYPTAFLFGAKAAPGYYRAKAIIKLINEIAKLINTDFATKDLIQVLFVQNYNVSYAERLIPAADISEQISTAGTEASGTGNMKLMLNGAVTLGTLDGANVEIVEQAGWHNNYIFGARLEDIENIKNDYDPRSLYRNNHRIHRAVDALVNGTLRDNDTGMFAALYHSLLNPTYNNADHYFVLHDFIAYCDARLQINRDYRNRWDFSRKCITNIANAGKFSSDRTIRQYADEIWHV